MNLNKMKLGVLNMSEVPRVDKSAEDVESFESAVYDDVEEDTIQHIRTLPNIEVHDGACRASEDDIPLSIRAEQQRAAKNRNISLPQKNHP